MRKTELFLKRFFSLNSNLGCILVALQLTSKYTHCVYFNYINLRKKTIKIYKYLIISIFIFINFGLAQ